MSGSPMSTGSVAMASQRPENVEGCFPHKARCEAKESQRTLEKVLGFSAAALIFGTLAVASIITLGGALVGFSLIAALAVKCCTVTRDITPESSEFSSILSEVREVSFKASNTRPKPSPEPSPEPSPGDKQWIDKKAQEYVSKQAELKAAQHESPDSPAFKDVVKLKEAKLKEAEVEKELNAHLSSVEQKLSSYEKAKKPPLQEDVDALKQHSDARYKFLKEKLDKVQALIKTIKRRRALEKQIDAAIKKISSFNELVKDFNPEEPAYQAMRKSLGIDNVKTNLNSLLEQAEQAN